MNNMHQAIKKLTCRDTTWLVSCARDSALAADELAALDAHLVTCGACRTAKQQFEQLFSQLDTLLAKPQLSSSPKEAS